MGGRLLVYCASVPKMRSVAAAYRPTYRTKEKDPEFLVFRRPFLLCLCCRPVQPMYEILNVINKPTCLWHVSDGVTCVYVQSSRLVLSRLHCRVGGKARYVMFGMHGVGRITTWFGAYDSRYFVFGLGTECTIQPGQRPWVVSSPSSLSKT